MLPITIAYRLRKVKRKKGGHGKKIFSGQRLLRMVNVLLAAFS
jgi:hypothetical protein